MKYTYHFLITIICITASSHAMNLGFILNNEKKNPTTTTLTERTLFPNKNEFELLPFYTQRNEIFDKLREILHQPLLQAIIENPNDKNLQIINRALNIMATIMTRLIKKNDPMLKKDLVNDPNLGTKVGIFTMTQCLDLKYLLENQLIPDIEKRPLTYRAYLAAAAQLGCNLDELVYIRNGETSTQQAIHIKSVTETPIEFLSEYLLSVIFRREASYPCRETDVLHLLLKESPEKLENFKKQKQFFNTDPITTKNILTQKLTRDDLQNHIQSISKNLQDHPIEVLTHIAMHAKQLQSETSLLETNKNLKKRLMTHLAILYTSIKHAENHTKEFGLLVPPSAAYIARAVVLTTYMKQELQNLANHTNLNDFDIKAEETAKICDLLHQKLIAPIAIYNS